MRWITLFLVAWLLIRLLTWLVRGARRWLRQRHGPSLPAGAGTPPASGSSLGISAAARARIRHAPDQARALALAWPMAQHRIPDGFDEDAREVYSDALLDELRRGLALQLDLPATASDHAHAALLAERAPRDWLRWDVAALRPGEDWRIGMAFACGRTAYALRVAYLVGWLDAGTQWLLLARNAERAQGCFHGWADFAHAFAQGRAQWIRGGRADNLGTAVRAADIDQWCAQPGHPWHELAWRGVGPPPALPSSDPNRAQPASRLGL